MAKYRVVMKEVTFYELIVDDAADKQEAAEIAMETDGGEFHEIVNCRSGGWEIETVQEIPE